MLKYKKIFPIVFICKFHLRNSNLAGILPLNGSFFIFLLNLNSGIPGTPFTIAFSTGW